jgi:hypothetical protein
MDAARPSSDRELRALSTKDLLNLIQHDIAELDKIDKVRRDLREPDPIIRPALHTVSCCGVHMGDFVAIAGVRCPFCGTWYKAGNAPPVS